MKSDDQRVELPHFPALEKCILVDARHGSRIERVKDLRATALFEKVIEAQSLGHGLGMVAAQETDAVCIGPSVTVDAACKFLVRAKKEVLSNDVAFFVIVNQLAEDTQPLHDAGAHVVIRLPYSRMYLFEHIIEAVVKANANSSWSTLYKQCVEKGAFGSVKTLVVDADRQKVDAAVTRCVTGLVDIVEGVERGEYNLTPSGEPSRRTSEALSDVAERIAHDSMVGKFHMANQSELEGVFERWFQELINSDADGALAILQKDLKKVLSKSQA